MQSKISINSNNINQSLPQSPQISHFVEDKNPGSEDKLYEFRVVGDGDDDVQLYQDKELQKEIFSIQLYDQQLVEGYHIDDDFKIVYLTQYDAYISSMDLREVGGEEGDDKENGNMLQKCEQCQEKKPNGKTDDGASFYCDDCRAQWMQ